VKKLLALLALLAACHRGSPIVNADLAAPQAPPDLLAAPPATPLLTLDGKRVDLAAYRKRVTVIAFWATFCEPCMKELPMLGALYEKEKADRDVSIIAVALDPVASDADRVHVAEIAKALKLPFPVLIDAQQALAPRFSHKDGETADAGGQGMPMPTTVVLLATGHYARRSGFDPQITTDSFVNDGMATIARAEAGTLPEDQYDDAPIDLTKGGTVKMMVPAIPTAAFTTEWPKIEAQLTGKVSAAAIAAAKAQLQAGKPATIELPLSALKK